MANPIRKLVQLVFDRTSGRRTEEDAKKSLSGVEAALNKLKRAAVTVGGVMAAAFSVRAIIRFGKEAVRAAAEAEAIWNRLGQAVRNAGHDFQALEPEIRAVARAMQDVTTVGDEDFAATLTDLVTITNDLGASVRNVGVVADLAAAKQIDLRTAAQLVGRAMIGETALLKRYGIIVDEGADAVEVMRQQFAGFAENEAQSFEGRIRQLSNEWGDFKEAVGDAMIAAGGGTSVLETMIGVVKGLTGAVERNADVFSGAATVLGTVAKVVGMVFEGLGYIANLINGFVIGAFAGLVMVTSGAAEALALASGAASRFLDAIGADSAAAKLDAFAERVRSTSEDLRQMALIARAAADASYAAGLGMGGTRPPRRSGSSPGAFSVPPGDRPRSGAGAGESDADKERNRLLKEAEQITESLRNATEIYSDRIVQLTEHYDAGRISLETYTRGIREADEALRQAREAADEQGTAVRNALADMDRALDANATMAAVLGGQYEALATEAAILESTMQALANAGIPAVDERMGGLADRLRTVQDEMKLIQREAQLVASVAGTAGEIVGAAFGGGIGQLADYKARQNAVLAAEHTAHGIAAALGIVTAGKAAGHFAAAAKYAAVAGAWKALAGAVGGGGGGTTGVGSRSDVGGRASERAQQPGPEVHIYFEGPGFDAVNPEVQRVVAGAQQFVNERYGPNATVRTHRRGGRG